MDKKDVILSGDHALGDRFNMVYSGSLVTGGRAVILVTATGMYTEIGKIASLMNRKEWVNTWQNKVWTIMQKNWNPLSSR